MCQTNFLNIMINPRRDLEVGVSGKSSHFPALRGRDVGNGASKTDRQSDNGIGNIGGACHRGAMDGMGKKDGTGGQVRTVGLWIHNPAL